MEQINRFKPLVCSFFPSAKIIYQEQHELKTAPTWTAVLIKEVLIEEDPPLTPYAPYEEGLEVVFCITEICADDTSKFHEHHFQHCFWTNRGWNKVGQDPRQIGLPANVLEQVETVLANQFSGAGA